MQYIDLEHIKGKDVFIACQPEILDFTSFTKAKLVVYGGGKAFAIQLPHNAVKLREAIGLLKSSLFTVAKRVLGWNVKSLFSFAMHYARGVEFPGRVLDLKILEAFSGVPFQHCPESCEDAYDRMTVVAKGKNWALPAIETTPLVHNELK